MKRALLTIDDIPSRNTPALVDCLNEKAISAILFATGENIEKYPKEAVYAVRNGMIVGNHSYSHARFSNLSLDECITEIEKCERVLENLYQQSGVKRLCRPFRFPYGDKGGRNKEALQQYLQARGFHKVDDTAIPYSWWKEYQMDTNMDTFWTFDFEEYRIHSDRSFGREKVWEKVNDLHPVKGAPLLAEDSRHIILMHAHDETEMVWPEYYRELLDHLIRNGMQFDPPSFL